MDPGDGFSALSCSCILHLFLPDFLCLGCELSGFVNSSTLNPDITAGCPSPRLTASPTADDPNRPTRSACLKAFQTVHRVLTRSTTSS
jgi:hypothetical protein